MTLGPGGTRAEPSDRTEGAPIRDRSTVTARDRASVAVLTAILAASAILVAFPSAVPLVDDVGPAASAGAFTTPTVTRYREGVIGGWSSVTPLSAMTLADRQLVALVFAGLVKLGPGQELLPDLASGWRVEEDGKRYVVDIRPDARWHDETPVTAEDVVFTVDALKDPSYGGPLAASWQEVTVTRVGERTVRFDLASALAGFPQALTQPLLPRHLLEGLTPGEIADSPFASAPVGAGRFRLAALDVDRAELVRVAPAEPSSPPPTPAPPPAATSGDATAGSGDATTATAPPTPTPAPTEPPAIGEPIDVLEMRFYPSAERLLAALAADEIDGAAGLAPDGVAAGVAAGATAHRYPTATLTAIVPNLRGTSTFRNILIRTALTQAIDRDALVRGVMGDEAIRADGLIPSSSWAYDAGSTPPIPFDASAATASLKKAGWTSGDESWTAKGRKTPLTLQLIAPDEATSPLTWAAAERVADGWRAIGFAVELTGLKREELARRLQLGEFMLSVVSINLGLDPDLYPFLASTQVRTDGSNISGYQNRDLDNLLAKARIPGSPFDRRTAYKRIQAYLAGNDPILPLYFSRQALLVSPRVSGVSIRQIGDPGDRYWDVLTWRLADGR